MINLKLKKWMFLPLGLRSDGSFRMTDDSLDYLFNADAPADWFVKFPLKVRGLIDSINRLSEYYTKCHHEPTNIILIG